MKNIFLFALLTLISVNLIAQEGSIKVFTQIKSAEFKIVFNDVLQNKIPIETITFDSLETEKYHNVTISFTADTIADINREIYLFKGENREYEILKKAKIMKQASNFRRKAGKLLKLGGDHDQDEKLYDIYYLVRDE